MLWIPGTAGFLVHAVDHEVEVWVARVAMRHDQRLMVLQPEVGQQTIRDAYHRGAIDSVLRIEGKRDVIDGLLDSIRASCRRPHDQPGGFWVLCGEIPRLDPRDAVRVVAVSPELEVARET